MYCDLLINIQCTTMVSKLLVLTSITLWDSLLQKLLMKFNEQTVIFSSKILNTNALAQEQIMHTKTTIN